MATPRTTTLAPASPKTVRSTAKAAATPAPERKAPAKTAPKRVERPKPSARRAAVSPEQRLDMIREAAYYLAERRGFAQGDALQDWIVAEMEIDERLAGAR